jgi:hypothetical protein
MSPVGIFQGRFKIQCLRSAILARAPLTGQKAQAYCSGDFLPPSESRSCHPGAGLARQVAIYSSKPVSKIRNSLAIAITGPIRDDSQCEVCGPGRLSPRTKSVTISPPPGDASPRGTAEVRPFMTSEIQLGSATPPTLLPSPDGTSRVIRRQNTYRATLDGPEPVLVFGPNEDEDSLCSNSVLRRIDRDFDWNAAIMEVDDSPQCKAGPCGGCSSRQILNNEEEAPLGLQL